MTTDQFQARAANPGPRFRHAPADWTPAVAEHIAREENLALVEDHWELVRSLQEFFARHDEGEVRLRDLHDALDERFHHKGGIEYLYTLCPGGPIAPGQPLGEVEGPVRCH
jgi:tRNA 2-thiouridine synthesizing protein E